MASAKQRNLEALFYDAYAERKILETLPRMSRAATDEKLKNAFEKHRVERRQLQNSREVPRARPMKEIIKECPDTPTLDARLISSAQAVEHYEMTRYDTLKRGAETLGDKDVAKLAEPSANLRAEAPYSARTDSS